MLALRLLLQLARHQEARPEVWQAKEVRHGLWQRLKAGKGEEVVTLLAVLALSCSLHQALEREGVVELVVGWMVQEAEAVQYEEDRLRGGWRLLQRLLAVWVEQDGAEEALDNAQWQWRALQALRPHAVPAALYATHRSVARRLVKSPAFLRLLLAVPDEDSSDVVLLERARVLASMMAALHPGPSQRSSERAGPVADAAFPAVDSSALEALLVPLSYSALFAHQHAAAQAWRAWLQRGHAGMQQDDRFLQQSVLHLLESDCALVVNAALDTVTAIRLGLPECARVEEARSRWAVHVAKVKATEPDERTDEDGYVLHMHERFTNVTASLAAEAAEEEDEDDLPGDGEDVGS